MYLGDIFTVPGSLAGLPGAVDSVRLRRSRSAGRAAAHGQPTFGGEAACRGRTATSRRPTGTCACLPRPRYDSAGKVVRRHRDPRAAPDAAARCFSGASTAFGAPPNTQASAVDIALPGTLPVAEPRAPSSTPSASASPSAATISRRSIFARKNYFYPDLPEGLPDQPVRDADRAGRRASRSSSTSEEKIDPPHARAPRGGRGQVAARRLRTASSGIDLNRAGTPLLEIVSEPEHARREGGGGLCAARCTRW